MMKILFTLYFCYFVSINALPIDDVQEDAKEMMEGIGEDVTTLEEFIESSGPPTLYRVKHERKLNDEDHADSDLVSAVDEDLADSDLVSDVDSDLDYAPLRSNSSSYYASSDSASPSASSASNFTNSTNSTNSTFARPGRHFGVPPPVPHHDCSQICGAAPSLRLTDTCVSSRWTPYYEDRGGCECLAAYRCCPAKCPVKLAKCESGLFYSTDKEEYDCCGCRVVKCLPCEPVLSKKDRCSSLGLPLRCYEYDPRGTVRADTGCFESTCEYKPPPPPEDEHPLSCDMNCTRPVTLRTECNVPYTVCKPTKLIDSCKNQAKPGQASAGQPRSGPTLSGQTELAQVTENLDAPLHCYNALRQVDDPECGKYCVKINGRNTCVNCKKWVRDKKSCATQNAIVAADNCRRFDAGKMDQKCWRKQVDKDECGCDVLKCLESDDKEVIIPANVNCPENHRRIAAVSPCMKVRDACIPCKPVIAPPCPYGKTVDDSDCNGCPIKKCVMPTIPERVCSCNRYLRVANALHCFCGGADMYAIQAAIDNAQGGLQPTAVPQRFNAG